MEDVRQQIAEQLQEWFATVSRLTSSTFFGSDGPHRDAIVLDVLRRNARVIYEANPVGNGSLYSPLCFFLAAACEKLKVSLGTGHWRAAIDNVAHLRQQLMEADDQLAAVGLGVVSPTEFFRREFEEAVRQAGLGEGPSYLTPSSRQVATGLAVNWGMRLLLSYASECSSPAGEPERRDLAWLSSLMKTIVTTPSVAL